MTNFNTYQTRHFYVAEAIDANVDTNLDIALAATAESEYFFFKYMNADGLVTRSDLINPKWIRSVKKTTSDEMARPLMVHTVALDSAVTLADLKGKNVNLTVDFQEFIDYSPSSGFAVTASIVGDNSNTANATAFYLAVAKALYKALPKKEYPYVKIYAGASGDTEITDDNFDSIAGYASGVVIAEAAQKYVRGKLSGEAIPFTVSTSVRASNIDVFPWGVDTVAAGSDVIPAAQILADLEYFALGERGDVYRGSTWPNNFEPTYAIDLAEEYDVLTIEYYWQGTAENVQKSPRMIQIAAPAGGSSAGVVDTLFDDVQALMAGISIS